MASEALDAPAMRPEGPPLSKRVVIIGGGIAGLTAGRALLDAGAAVFIYEKRSLEEMLSGEGLLRVEEHVWL